VLGFNSGIAILAANALPVLRCFAINRDVARQRLVVAFEPVWYSSDCDGALEYSGLLPFYGEMIGRAQFVLGVGASTSAEAERRYSTAAL
jgi:hypothetical protein